MLRTLGSIVCAVLLIALVVALIFKESFRSDVLGGEGEASILRIITVRGAAIVLLAGLLLGGLVFFAGGATLPGQVSSVVLDSLEAYKARIDSLQRRTETQTLDLEPPGLQEPSGLTRTNLSTDEQPMLLAVDDEQYGVFVLEATDEGIQVHGPIRFSFEGSLGKDPNDLEAVCFNDLNYFATTSHRRLGDAFQPQRRLLRFALGQQWQANDYSINLQPEDIRDISPGLGRLLESSGVSVSQEQWTRNDITHRYPYAVEIEGLACFGERLLFGLRWPLHDGKALLAQYDWARDEFVGDLVSLDLKSKGISALTYEPSREILLVAANPPEHVYDDDKPDTVYAYLGNSELYLLKWNPTAQAGPTVVQGFREYARPEATLEGISLVGDELWLSYEGRAPAIKRIPLPGSRIEAALR